jgi:uncharacterized membrane protein
MTDPTHGWTDERVEKIVGNLLRTGVLLAAALVVVGAVLYLARHGADRPDDHIYHAKPTEQLRNPVEIVTAATEGNDSGIIQLGLLLLIATPVARVVFSAVAFGLQRDYAYVGMTLIVLAVLLYSLFFGHP